MAIHWHIKFNVWGCFGLFGSKRRPVGNHVTPNKFVRIDFNNGTGFV